MGLSPDSPIEALGPKFGIALAEDGAYFGTVGDTGTTSYTATVFFGANAANSTQIGTTDQEIRPASIEAGKVVDGVPTFYGTLDQGIAGFPVSKVGSNYYIAQGFTSALSCVPINGLRFSSGNHPLAQFVVSCGQEPAPELWHGGWGIDSPTRIANTSSVPTSYVGSASHHFITEVGGYRATDPDSPDIAQLATRCSARVVDGFSVGGLVQVAGRGPNDEGVFVLVRGIESSSPPHYVWYAGNFADDEFGDLEAESVAQLSKFAEQTGDDAVVYYHLSQNDVSTIATGVRQGGGIRFTYFDRAGRPLAVDVPVAEDVRDSSAQAFQLGSDGRMMVVWLAPDEPNTFYSRRFKCDYE